LDRVRKICPYVSINTYVTTGKEHPNMHTIRTPLPHIVVGCRVTSHPDDGDACDEQRQEDETEPMRAQREQLHSG